MAITRHHQHGAFEYPTAVFPALPLWATAELGVDTDRQHQRSYSTSQHCSYYSATLAVCFIIYHILRHLLVFTACTVVREVSLSMVG